jgi:hypothetical protein
MNIGGTICPCDGGVFFLLETPMSLDAMKYLMRCGSQRKVLPSRRA